MSSSQPHHFLFLLPDSTTPAEKEVVVNAAKHLTSLGYVYVASPDEKTMADRENIRFMPLKLHRLPCFGTVTSVMIVRDRHLALAAQEAYPRTRVTVFDPAQATLAHELNEFMETEGKTVPLPMLVPLMARVSLPQAA